MHIERSTNKVVTFVSCVPEGILDAITRQLAERGSSTGGDAPASSGHAPRAPAGGAFFGSIGGAALRDSSR
jgi:hypothetical protein